MREHAADDAERPAGEIGGDLEPRGIRRELEQHKVSGADAERGEEGGPVVPAVDVQALQAEEEDQGEAAGEEGEGGHAANKSPVPRIAMERFFDACL